MSDATCSVAGCEGVHHRRGFCRTHFNRWQKYGDPMGGGPFRKPKPIKKCTIDGCERHLVSRGMCRLHYCRWRRQGDPMKVLHADDGVGHLNCHGYRIITVDGKRIAEHRHLMQQYLGRKLRDGENVHHVNGDRADNRLENLEIWNTSQPPGQRIPDKVAWAIELLEMYAPNALSGEPYQLQL